MNLDQLYMDMDEDVEGAILNGICNEPPENIPPIKSNPFLDVVLKFNEHHDELGRFATSDGSGNTDWRSGILHTGTFGLLPAAEKLAQDRMDKEGITSKMLTDEIKGRIGGVDSVVMNDAAHWYPIARNASAAMANKYNVSVEQSIAVVAVISPRCEWNENLRVADMMMQFHSSHKFTDAQSESFAFIERYGANIKALPTQITKGFQVLNGDNIDKTLGGFKVRSFYNNISEPNTTNDVTIDTHMIKIFGRAKPDMSEKEAISIMNAGSIKESQKIGSVGHVVLTDAIRRVAQEYKVNPDVVQADYWIATKNEKFKWSPNKVKPNA